MTDVHSPEQRTHPASIRLSAVSATPKLRDSCHACAASKVKCSKEKPTCARCWKRGLPCEYVVTRRAGRKHDARPSSRTNVTQPLPGTSSSTSSETGIRTPYNIVQPSPKQHASGYPDTFSDILSFADPAWSSTVTSLSTELDDLSASPFSFSTSETFNTESLAQSHIDFRAVNNGLLGSDSVAGFSLPDDAFSVIDQADCELPPQSRPRSPPNNRDPIASNAQNPQDFRSQSPHCCLARALGLLNQLFPNASKTCTHSGKLDYENATYSLPTIQSVIAENEETIEAICKMLQCPCSQDGHLLVIMSLIVFKVLGWYAAVARETPTTDKNHSPSKSRPDHGQSPLSYSERVLQSPTVVGSYCIDGEDQGRMAAQLVLSKLHPVQRLVNLLSERLKGYGMRNGTAVGTPDSTADGQNTPVDGESTSPFSASMLDQLEADLRKRLRALSLEIVDMLRRA